MLKRIQIVLVTFIAVIIGISMSACSSDKLEEVPFTLNYSSENFNPPTVTLMKNKSDFDSFLTDQNIFSDELSADFVKINEGYSEEFFEQNDLIAVIVQATSSMITGYRLKETTKENGLWIVKIESITSSAIITDDMGRYFCYYLTVEKDIAINGAELKR